MIASQNFAIRKGDNDRWPCLVVFSFSILLASVGVCEEDSDGERSADRDALEALANGYSSNRDAFQWIDCRFEVISASADSLDAALRGESNETKLVRHGRWLVNENLTYYELLCDAETNAAVQRRLRERESDPPSGGAGSLQMVSIDCEDTYFMRNEESGYTLGYSPLTSGAKLFAESDPVTVGASDAPFARGVMGPNGDKSPAMSIRNALDGQWDYRYIGSEDAPNGTSMLVCVVGPNDDKRMGFDPERAYLATMMSVKNPRFGNRRFYVSYILHAEKCANDAWFPMESIYISNPDGEPPFTTVKISVTALSVDSPPPLDAFALQLPAGTQVNRSSAMEWFTLSEAETVNVKDLKGLHERAIQHGQEFSAPQVEIQQLQHQRYETFKEKRELKQIANAKRSRYVGVGVNLVMLGLVSLGIFWVRAIRKT